MYNRSIAIPQLATRYTIAVISLQNIAFNTDSLSCRTDLWYRHQQVDLALVMDVAVGL